MPRAQMKRASSVAAQRRLSHTTGFAVPVLTEPFPAPDVVTVTCTKPAKTGKLGVCFRWSGARGDRVRISKIAEHSPLLDTVLQQGHIVLAINGVAALTSTQAASLIRDSGPNVTITACVESSVHAPYCKLVTAPTWKHHPGINFNSCRDRCLVQVSRVFSKGPFAGSDLSIGDIVLAVNGVPVSKPEDADRELREAQQRQPFTILYVVKMTAYRDSVLAEMRTSPIFHNVRLIQDERSLYRCNEVLFAAGDEIYAKLDLDFESQHLVDREAFLRLGSFAKGAYFCDATKSFGRQYRALVLPFLETYNEGMEGRMRVLEEAVCCAAWKHIAETRVEAASERSSPRDERRTGESPATVSSEKDDEDSHTMTVPVAVAEIEVLPMEALQTLSERSISKNLAVRDV